MQLTFHLTVRSPCGYLAILDALDKAVSSRQLDLEFSLKPTRESLRVLAEHPIKEGGDTSLTLR